MTAAALPAPSPASSPAMSSAAPRALPTVLLVDDTPENIYVISALLDDLYEIRAVASGEAALEAVNASVPDIVLLDVVMPGLNGYQVCRRLAADPASADVPVILLTASPETEGEAQGFEAGAVDYIVKPVNPRVLRSRVATHLSLRLANRRLRERALGLQDELVRRAQELAHAQDATICALSALVETRDNETGGHIHRTQHYVRAIAQTLQCTADFRAALTPEVIELLFKSAPLHDVGKIGIDDRILRKPGRLTPAEFDIMKTHTTIGGTALAEAQRHCGGGGAFLRIASEIARSHHERWSGGGYPDGLAGEAIPLSARIMAIADVYDALISERVYKAALPHDEAMRLLRAQRGQHFDPRVVDAFVRAEPEIRAIARRYADAGPKHGGAAPAPGIS
ncbi:HD-GYP domain-containing protein [Cupriavidus sp. 30B13]|uniref:HD-GYP domain-containing protein n=1 Tax=Cupriavidus sp. 30B13 TaxID=3384241 RepID=UPI003B8EDE40